MTALVWQAVLAGLLDLPTLATDSTGIQCPTALFWGDRDAMFGRADQDALMGLIPGARLQVFADVGHAVHWEAPDEFAKQLNRAIG